MVSNGRPFTSCTTEEVIGNGSLVQIQRGPATVIDRIHGLKSGLCLVTLKDQSFRGESGWFTSLVTITASLGFLGSGRQPTLMSAQPGGRRRTDTMTYSLGSRDVLQGRGTDAQWRAGPFYCLPIAAAVIGRVDECPVDGVE